MTGKQVQDFRERYNLSKSQLAKLLDVHITTITNWESDPEKPISKKYLGPMEVLQGKLKELKDAAGGTYSDAALGTILTGAAGLLVGGLIGGLIGTILKDEKKK